MARCEAPSGLAISVASSGSEASRSADVRPTYASALASTARTQGRSRSARNPGCQCASPGVIDSRFRGSKTPPLRAGARFVDRDELVDRGELVLSWTQHAADALHVFAGALGAGGDDGDVRFGDVDPFVE